MAKKYDDVSPSELSDVLACPKCKGIDIYTRYHESQYGTGSRGCNVMDLSKWEGEHLHHYCKKCGYDWTSPVAS